MTRMERKEYVHNRQDFSHREADERWLLHGVVQRKDWAERNASLTILFAVLPMVLLFFFFYPWSGFAIGGFPPFFLFRSFIRGIREIRGPAFLFCHPWGG